LKNENSVGYEARTAVNVATSRCKKNLAVDNRATFCVRDETWERKEILPGAARVNVGSGQSAVLDFNLPTFSAKKIG